MSNEGTSRSTAGDRLQDGCLNLDITVLVEKLAHGGHNLRALNEYLTHVGINHQINITLTVAHLGVGQCVKLLAILLLYDGQGTDRL